MTCPGDSDRLFGPRVDSSCRQFDFTLEFEDVVFGCIPAAVFIILSPINIFQLLRVSKIGLRQWNMLLACRLVVLVGLFSVQIAFLATRLQNSSLTTPASLASDVLSCAATVAALALSFTSHRRAIRPSTALSLYLSATVTLGIARVRTLWILGHAIHEASLATAGLVLTAIALLLESIKGTPVVGAEKLANSPEVYSGFWNRIAFAWLSTTFRLGYAKVISVNDLPDLDTKLESSVLHETLMATWAKYNHHQKNSLLRATFRSYIPSLLSTIIPRLCLTAFTFAQPFLINTTVNFIGQSDATSDGNYGKGLIGAWALAYIGIAVASSIYQYQNLRFIMRLRGGLTALVYQRTLQTRTADLGDITAVSLMGTDVERIVAGLRMFNETWSSLLDMAIACWLLERQLSLACLAPVVLILVFIAATSKVSASASSAQRQWIEKVQERLKVTSTLLSNIKAVKMLGISQVMSTIMHRLRMDEIKTSRGFRKILVITMLLSLSPINLAPVITFAVYVIISIYWKNETLLTAQAFTSISLITLLTTPVIVFIQAMPQVAQCIGSFDRIQEYCNYYDGTENSESSDTSGIKLGDVSPLEKNTQPISIKGSYSWDKASPPVLKDLDLSIQRGSITGIVGPVGSGKSALLNALLGEMVAASPNSTAAPPQEAVAYCSQQSWLENKTIRKNITGALPFHEKWYKVVKFACGLDVDISLLEKHDETRVGSQGLNLSGGQKQRIALARAVYSKARIVLLDDIFSGMDANTALRVSSRLLGPEGLLRQNTYTVILATHNKAIMRLANHVIALDGGRTIETGQTDELLQGGSYVSTLGLLPPPEHAIEETPEANVDSNDSPEVLKAPTESDDDNDVRRKNGDLSVYKYYITSSGYGVFAANMFFMAIWIFCTEFSSIWVKWWSEGNDQQPNKNVGMYLGVYAMLGVIGTVGASLAGWTAVISIISNSAAALHSDLLRVTLRAPLKFFSATDSGEILNRFSQDMELIDMDLPTSLINYTSTAMECLAKIVIIAVFSKYLGIAMPFMGVTLYFVQRFYLYTSRQIRLLGIEAKAPLYSSFTETVDGVSVIRAFGWQRQYQLQNYGLIGASQQPEYMLSCVQACLGFVLKMLTAVLAVALVSISITLKDKFSAGSVGVSLVMIVGFGETLVRLIQSWTRLESSIGAVARVKRFVEETDVEDAGSTGRHAPSNWPQAGSVEISHLTASYTSSSEPVLRNISLSIEPGHHVAICGRSGGGKSSLVLSLLNMIDITEGSIAIDGIDIRSVVSDDLRTAINVVPQDPFLLPGSVRRTVDPAGSACDDEVIAALERVGMWRSIEDQGGLGQVLDPSAWSAGQRQLLCFARAMVRRCKILALDESASSVDSVTEAVMQDVIDTEFKSCTVLSVMHRLTNVALYDRVAVLENGSLLEYGKPCELLGMQSKFAELYNSSGGHRANEDDI